MENRFMNIEERIEELLSKMTLHEKVGQLHQVAPSKVGGFEIPEEEAFKLYKSGDMDEKTYDAIINHKMLSNHEDELRKGEIGSFISVMDAEPLSKKCGGGEPVGNTFNLWFGCYSWI